MLRFKFLRNLLILALAIAILLPCYEYFIVHPSYKKLLQTETEREAVRYASYMLRTLGLENQTLTKDRLPPGLDKNMEPVSWDKHLLKIRIFSTQGEIIFSTQATEIGTLNKNDYFHNIVAKGRVYSKVVQKDRKTAEGELSKIDIVETYVPFMAEESFGGAFEVYYDITESVQRIDQLTSRSMVSILIMSLGFLLAISLALYRAYASLLEREAAEEALRDANEELEERVNERTQELTDANVQLTDQISERIQAQKALSEALEESRIDREKLDEILRSVPDGVVVTDGALNVLHMNAAAEEILSVSLADMIGQSVDKLSSKVDFVKKVGQRLNIVHGSRSFDFELPDESGHKENVYQVRISQFVSDANDSPGIVLLIRDVTREREVELMKSAFLGMAAHELNTPLTTIIGYTELLTAKETSGNFSTEQQRDYLQLIHDKALALGGLIDDLLDVSRIESGRPLTLSYQEFSINEMVEELIASCRDEFSELDLSLDAPVEPLKICADRQRLGQVLEHLVSNAAKYSPGGGKVQVSLAASEGELEIVVADEGIGMNEEQLAHIFDRFYRADSSDTAVQGVGLGMNIVQHVVLAHQGDIHVESQLGSGTKVVITLPATPPPESVDGYQPFSL